MIKKFLALCLAIASFNVSRAQSDSAYAEVGINAMRLLTFGNAPQATTNPEAWNPYLFTLEGGVKNFGVRVGFSRFKHDHTVFPVDINGNDRIDTDSSSANVRIGLFYSYNPDEKWSFKIGVDYYSFNTKFYERREFIQQDDQKLAIHETTHDYKETGFAPFINAQYHITPRVSLGTELLFKNGNYKQNVDGTSTISPLDVSRKFEGKRSYFVLPTALFLTFRL